jgi:DNA-binding XRE family transcriptional regulator
VEESSVSHVLTITSENRLALWGIHPTKDLPLAFKVARLFQLPMEDIFEDNGK